TATAAVRLRTTRAVDEGVHRERAAAVAHLEPKRAFVRRLSGQGLLAVTELRVAHGAVGAVLIAGTSAARHWHAGAVAIQIEGARVTVGACWGRCYLAVHVGHHADCRLGRAMTSWRAVES